MGQLVVDRMGYMAAAAGVAAAGAAGMAGHTVVEEEHTLAAVHRDLFGVQLRGLEAEELHRRRGLHWPT